MATLLKDLLIGAGAGLAGGCALGGAAQSIYALTSAENVRRENAIEPREPYVVLAQQVEGLTGTEMGEAGQKHFALGVGLGMTAAAGAAYAAVVRHRDLNWLASGAALGVLFWAVGDEGLGTALGLVGDNTKYPAEAHLRGLAAHTVFGVVTAGLVEAFNRSNSTPRASRRPDARERLASRR